MCERFLTKGAPASENKTLMEPRNYSMAGVFDFVERKIKNF